MSQFIQIHMLSSYPPANLNRDDLGQPKTAMMGGAKRLRISSQSLKRAWRTSDFFKDGAELEKEIGKRTKKFAREWVYDELIQKGVSEEQAKLWTNDLQKVFGEPDKDSMINKQLAHISPLEELGVGQIVDDVARHLVDKNEAPPYLLEIIKDQEKRNKKDKKKDEITKEIVKKLQEEIFNSGKTCVDIALFGRMLTSAPKYNIDASVQVAHAISVHKVTIEDDYFTAVDDLNVEKEDVGAAHIGVSEFAAGLFYLYVCINKDLLNKNLSKDEKLTKKTLRALLESTVKISPTGKQNSFASRAYASYVLVEKGDQQPRSLSVAYLEPVPDKGNTLEEAIKKLGETMENIDKVYGKCADSRKLLNAVTGEGTLDELLKFIEA